MMIKLYVSEKEHISRDCLYADETKLVSWFEETECELEHEDCQLLLLEDKLKEERKKVCDKIKAYITRHYLAEITTGGDIIARIVLNDLNLILNIIEEGKDGSFI